GRDGSRRIPQGVREQPSPPLAHSRHPPERAQEVHPRAAKDPRQAHQGTLAGKSLGEDQLPQPAPRLPVCQPGQVEVLPHARPQDHRREELQVLEIHVGKNPFCFEQKGFPPTTSFPKMTTRGPPLDLALPRGRRLRLDRVAKTRNTFLAASEATPTSHWA